MNPNKPNLGEIRLWQATADAVRSAHSPATVPTHGRLELGRVPYEARTTKQLTPRHGVATLEIQKLSDAQLYQKCKEYGTNARLWLRKFAGLLPEVMRRDLYKKKGYTSIYEFAAKLAGMSHKTVNRILRLDKRLEDKPVLREKLTSGSASWTKIEKVSYICTPETEKEWVEKIDSLSQPALETYIQEMRKQEASFDCLTSAKLGAAGSLPTDRQTQQVGKMTQSVLQNTFLPEPAENSSSTPAFENVPGNTSLTGARPEENSSSAITAEFELSQKTISFKATSKFESRLRLLKQKLEKESKKALSFQEVFEKLMDSYDKKQEVTNKAKVKKIVWLCPDCIKKKQLKKETLEQPTRHIPINIRKIIDNRSQGRCEFEGCNKPKEIYHHTKRFSLDKSHNPDFIIALCKNHERLCHAGLVEDEESSPENWKIRRQPETDERKFSIDRFVGSYRRADSSLAQASLRCTSAR